MSRHIPVRGYSVTMGRHLGLESQLEYELMLTLDRDPAVTRIVSQPVRLMFPVKSPLRKHTPDLLSVTDDAVTLWDARPPARQNERFQLAVERTAAACEQVGWRHRVFGGLDRVARLNLLWLSCFRMPRPWVEPRQRQLEQALNETGALTLGSVFDLDDDTGELVWAMWHLLWSGTLEADLTRHLDADSVLTGATDPTTQQHQSQLSGATGQPIDTAALPVRSLLPGGKLP